MRITGKILFTALLFGITLPVFAWTPYGPSGGYPPHMGPGPDMAPPPGPQRTGQLRVQRSRDTDAYHIRIFLAGEDDPSAIHVRVDRNAVLIKRQESTETQQQDRYGRSFSHSSSHSQRRIKLPPDADLSEMTRHDEGNAIEITIPRLK